MTVQTRTYSESTFETQVLQIAGLGVWAMVTGKPLARPVEPVIDDRWNQKSGLFVTLVKDGAVRGSVGLLEASQALQEALFEVAGMAATHDTRYPPVEGHELETMSLEVCLLTSFRTTKNALDIVIGKTGLIVSRGEKRAVLLPQVAEERGWTSEQFLEACCEKAGLSHKAWKDDNTLVEIFDGQFLNGSLKEMVSPFVDWDMEPMSHNHHHGSEKAESSCSHCNCQ